MKKIPVTVVIPVKNEERNLPHCLSLLSDFDQIMVIDSNSTDRTVEISEKQGAEVHQFNWNGKFPKKRNWVLRNLNIRNNWVLFLDADEYITDVFKKELQEKIKDPNISGFWITFENFFMGKKLKYGDPFKKLPLFRVGKGEYEQINEDSWSHLDMEVHEHPILEGKVGKMKAPVIHNDYKNLECYINRHNAYSTWEAKRFLTLKSNGFKNLNSRQLLKYRLMELGLLPIFYFLGSYLIKFGFLDGSKGFYFSQYKAHYFLQIQTKIKELEQL
ncbi:glycosyltransferase family 2 protein [Gillisia sp. M10.2A]|uniref:Glycosyltransferase family 2 protein n=1 Tax=Gillisia lutea TaxID=2909668 RepID=A0ABS9EIL0_9FLAO|nr:glycosyltransferase family 2 protein [Gillisia lutea]MCF4102187.1 glycosyltransferase family 2 protein [Gillisia lutea]